MISSFFKTRKPKQFNFHSRYYDANREELQERYDRIKEELEEKKANFGMRKADFKAQWKAQKKTSNFEAKSNIRLLIIFGLLCAICYFILFS